MSEDLWKSVDAFLNEQLVRPDAPLEAAVEGSNAAGLPSIQVAPNQGKLLMLLAQAMGAKRILEVGTLGGYSTIWLARALPSDGQLVTLEIKPDHAGVARANLDRAGVAALVDVRVGPALKTLPQLATEGAAPFDMAFIDADKPSSVEYFEWALKLSRPGSLIIVDNAVRGGKVVDADSPDANVQGMRRLIDHVANEPRVNATAIQTVGSKGYDGLVVAVVTATDQS